MLSSIQSASYRAGSAISPADPVAPAVYIPWRPADNYGDYSWTVSEIQTLATLRVFGTGIVSIKGKEHPDYSVMYNPLNCFSPAIIFMHDRSPQGRDQVTVRRIQ